MAEKINSVPMECHPLRPFLPEGAKVLMLGSFPPKRERWSMEFFYPNFNNDMWRIMGVIFFGDREHFITQGLKRFDRESVAGFCAEKGIALYDVAAAVRRLKDNASDMYLEIAEPTDIAGLLAEIPSCRAIAATGGKAAETVSQCFNCALPPVGGSVAIDISYPQTPISALPDTGGASSENPGTETASSENPVTGTKLIENTTGRRIKFYRMPSSSRAYPASLDTKAAAYRRMFSELGLL